jgi:hypothetical protein
VKHKKPLIGSFDFVLKKVPEKNLTYSLEQSAIVTVIQNQQVLALKHIEKINNAVQVHIDFEVDYLCDTVELVISTANPDDQFNRDNSIEVSNIIVDELFGIPFFSHNLQLIDCYNQIVNYSNSLYQSGKLVLSLKMPIASYIYYAK